MDLARCCGGVPRWFPPAGAHREPIPAPIIRLSVEKRGGRASTVLGSGGHVPAGGLATGDDWRIRAPARATLR